MERDIFTVIRDRLQSFSRGKQTIATYILENPNEAAFRTAATIGKTVGVSESSVVRFAGDLGFKGFPDFQHALQQVAMDRLRGDHSMDTHTAGTPSSCSEPIQEAVGELLQCHRLYILSDPIGSSLFPYCALWGQELGQTMTFLSTAHSDRVFRSLAAMESGDLLLCLLLQQPTDLLTFAMEQGRRMGARTLVLSHLRDREIVDSSDLCLPVPPGSSGPLSNLSPCMSLLHTLFLQWSGEKKEAITQQNKILEEIRTAYENRKSRNL